jgi:hypothetical protein
MKQQVIDKIIKIIKGYNIIEAVYLFGSQARNGSKEYSDIDIALLIEDNYTGSFGEIKVKLYEDLTKNGLDNIDLVILNQASALLKYEVVKENCLIYKKNKFDAASYQSLTIRKYLDFEYYLKKNQQKFKERLLHG